MVVSWGQVDDTVVERIPFLGDQLVSEGVTGGSYWVGQKEGCRQNFGLWKFHFLPPLNYRLYFYILSLPTACFDALIPLKLRVPHPPRFVPSPRGTHSPSLRHRTNTEYRALSSHSNYQKILFHCTTSSTSFPYFFSFLLKKTTANCRTNLQNCSTACCGKPYRNKESFPG